LQEIRDWQAKNPKKRTPVNRAVYSDEGKGFESGLREGRGKKDFPCWGKRVHGRLEKKDPGRGNVTRNVLVFLQGWNKRGRRKAAQ